MDIFLLVVTIVLALMILFVNVYLLAVYVHPDDRGFGSSVFPKILVVLGLTLSMGMVLMLPLDVANSVGSGGGLNMDLFWEIAMGAAALLLVVLIPFAYNYYETDETKSARRRFGIAFLYTLLSIIGFGVAFFISFLLLNEASLPIQEQTLSTTVTGSLQPSTTIINGTLPSGVNLTAPPTPNITDTVYTIDVTPPVYAMGFFSFLGWFLVVFFGGMGLFSVPMDLINSYRNKPLKKTPQELNKTKQELQNKLDGLIHMGQEIETSQKDAETQRGFLSKRSAKNKINKNLNRFKASILTLEEEFEKYAAEVNFAKINPLTFKVYLLLGIIFFAVSVLWFVHTILSSIHNSSGYPISTFLGDFFNHLENAYSLGFVATILFGCIAMYLLLVVTKGNVKFGLKIPFLFTIHPMKPNETLMNSFLFNVWMILMSTIGIIQFLTATLSQYTSITVAQSLFDGVIKYMKFYQFFYEYNIFELAFLAWSVLTLLWLWCCEGRGARVKKANDKKIRKINEAKQMKIEMQTKA